jgi:exonuclease VII small subunit
MNKATRKQLTELSEQLDTVKTKIEEIVGEERDKFENMNEGLQQSPTGAKLEEGADNLEEAISVLEDAVDNIDSAISSIDSAKE